MKIFLDTANLNHIKEATSFGILDGVTTNPTLISAEGRDFEATVKEICNIVKGPVSAEVIATDYNGMIKEAHHLNSIDEHIVVKIPFTANGLKATRQLSSENIEVNMTLIFSSTQGLLACKAGAKYVSPFVGRLDDIGQEGMKIAKDCQEIIFNYNFDAEVIAASIRNTQHIVRAAKIGIDIATIPYKILLQMMKHPLTDIGLKKFLSDWEEFKTKNKNL